MPGSILKTVNVHHAATRFVHTIPLLASYNREYLQTRTEMRLLAVLNKQNKKVILAADGINNGINKLPHTRRRILRQLQLQTAISRPKKLILTRRNKKENSSFCFSKRNHD
jgi:hypothetical protein